MWLSCSNAIFNQIAKVIKMFQCAFFAISVFQLHLWIYIKCACLLRIRWSIGKIFFMLISWFSVFIDFCLKKYRIFLPKYLRVSIFCRYFVSAFGTQPSARGKCSLIFLRRVFSVFFLGWNSSRKKIWKKVAKNFGKLKICLTFALAFGTEQQCRRNADDPWQHSIQTKQYNVSL